MTAVESSPAAVAAAEHAAASRHARWWVVLLGLIVLAAVVNGVLALLAPLPTLNPDEYRYGHLARSLADGQGFSWRGVHIDQKEALYIYLLAPIWRAFHDTVDAYDASKVLNTLLMCSGAVPVYLVSREIMRPAVALATTAVTLAGTWMFASHMIATEALAMPLTTASLCLAALAMYRGDRRLTAAAFALALLAALARAQMIVLLPALIVAFLLNALRDAARPRDVLRRYRVHLAVGIALCLLVVVVVFATPSLIGDYSVVTDFRPSLGRLAGKSALQAVDLVAATGILPAVLALAAATSPAAWRDSVCGPLLCVFVPVAAGTIAVSGFFLAGLGGLDWGIERYVWYVCPIAIVLAAAFAQSPRLITRRTLAPALALVALCALRPADPYSGEERGTWAIWDRVHHLVPLPAGVALAVVGVIGVAALIMATRGDLGRRATPLLVVLAATGSILVVQAEATWQSQLTMTRTFRSSLPHDLQWIDHHARGPVALLGVSSRSEWWSVIDFFNRSITSVYLPPSGFFGAPTGKTCTWQASGSDGSVGFSGCPPAPRTLFIADPQVRVTFASEVESFEDEHLGRLVRIAPGAPLKLRSMVLLPCTRAFPHLAGRSRTLIPASAPMTCGQNLQAQTWVPRAGQLVLRYAGGTADHTVTRDDGHQWNLPAQRVTTITMPLPAGPHQVALQDDWTTTAGTPRLLSVDAVVDGKRTSLI
ncbi:MAG TPA: hypothetical protein VFT50_11495 [Baekduia sp.]|nr:hypothetical protein [Baekduia sp.]